VIRLGVLSDLHCELEPSGSRWINAFETEQLERRVEKALAWFRAESVSAVLVLGDFVQHADLASFDHVAAQLGAETEVPVAAVSGNHDLRLGEAFATTAAARDIRLLPGGPLQLDGAMIEGVELRRTGEGLPFYAGEYAPSGTGALRVVASHFPLLTEAERVAGAGLPYAGDLVNRAPLADGVAGTAQPLVGLSGHIHARCSRAHGPILQFTVGALIEPPFDATVVELDPSAGTARRIARRLGPTMPVDPVFSPDDETWAWGADGWDRVG
jgi:hypothetical protein